MNNKLGKKLAMASLCACLAATSLTGCGAKEEKTVITVDDSKASYGLANLMLRYNQAQMQSFYGAFMGEDMWTTYGETAKESVVENLEELSCSFEGVESAFAVQAGREVRIMVEPGKVSDDQLILLSRSIAKKIEEELDYPGQIKVNVIRESRAVEYAK